MRFQVLVHGSVFFETNDVLLANAYASYTRKNGWTDVRVKVKESV